MSASKQQQNHDEDPTFFRSIPMGSAAAMKPLPSLPPLGVRPLPGALKGGLSLPGKPTAKPAPVATLKKTTSISWTVDADTIPSVPDYPLERTSMTCPASLSCDQVTKRICQVLEAHNLQCNVHDDDEADSSMEEEILPGRLDCVSGDLKFVVQLWRSPTNEIIVEVQRRRGSSLEFSAIRKPLFQTLQTGTVVVSRKKRFSPPAFVPNKRFRVLPPSMTVPCRS